ncbi:hypothetical protein K7432_014895 [Basidiobolus ranarum]|uniref:Carrier domain-containing protein n=1 Tax=Basidiobolus ranarum TaxID=34480 RepID=A0ABR2WGX8_9FUNG
MIEHRGVVHLALAQPTYLGIDPSSRILQFASISFDASVWEIFMALGCGASLYLPPGNVRRDRYELWNYLGKNEITHVTLPPTLLQNGEDLPKLNTRLTLILAGEAINTSLLQKLIQNYIIINGYGPTETTVCATTWRCSDDLSKEMIVPIGKPIADTRIYLLDIHGQLVPFGAIGEIYIGGSGIARGYLNHPELTAERFLRDPFSSREDARMYKTGDFARYDPDGNVIFLGRKDQQIKIRGFRIEPGEIEAHLIENPLVHQVAVTALGTDIDRRLIAYLVAEFDGQLARKLREYLTARIPEFMVPVAYVRINALPLTPNGKLDLRALPVPNAEAFSRNTYEVPRGEIEIALAGIWNEVLNIGHISRYDNFFSLGGHSLLALKMISRIGTILGLEIALRTVFEAPTLTELACHLLKSGVTNNDSFAILLPLKPSGSRSPLFCVHPFMGLSWSYIGLSRYVNVEQPIYGLQARGLNGIPPFAKSIDAMASDYIKHVRQIQPRGPYYLLGWSFGGKVAFTMATQLEQQGERVSLLVLLDCTPNHSPQSHELMNRQNLELIDGLASYSDEKSPDSREYVRKITRDVINNNNCIVKSFSPLVYSGDVLFFRATIAQDESGIIYSSDLWKPYVLGNIEVYDIHYKHQDLDSLAATAEFGPILAQKLDEYQKIPETR